MYLRTIDGHHLITATQDEAVARAVVEPDSWQLGEGGKPERNQDDEYNQDQGDWESSVHHREGGYVYMDDEWRTYGADELELFEGYPCPTCGELGPAEDCNCEDCGRVLSELASRRALKPSAKELELFGPRIKGHGE